MEGAGEDEVVRLLKEDWGCSFTEEEIIRADGILDVNSVQHRLEGLKFLKKVQKLRIHINLYIENNLII